ncbi:hypothetical protein LCGC14_2913130, partial [marine sediment metagenome]
MSSDQFDIVVIGGGHAGAEAAWAAARLGAETALITLRADRIARMPCNPAIGGVGKGQIVREIDAMGGLMGLAADATGIQFRMLNRSKGPAVWGPRCQCDRHAYAAFVQRALAERPGVTVIEGEVTEILTAGTPRRVTGVSIVRAGRDGHAERQSLRCGAIVLAAGTFLRGVMHCGPKTWSGGCYGEPSADSLSGSLRRLGVRLGRLKTGTCRRVAADTIDTDRCRRQDGDECPAAFSFLNAPPAIEQTPCWITATTEDIHQLIRDNLHRAPLFNGQIAATGPRYCPSVELKIDRFPDKASHQVFIEPEGLA